MRICALASGSSGNCFYVENENHNNKKNSILIDAGISCKQISERLMSIGKTPEQVKALFITHEHSDHIKGADVFSRKFNIPVFVSRKVADSRPITKNPDLITPIKSDETLKMIGLEISAFSKSHLALDPVSYSILDANKQKILSVITDAGYACENIQEKVSNSNFLCFESNYDEKMLDEGFYPWPTKKWIKSNEGHLSNTQSASCIIEHATKKLKHLMLSHISQNNNTPELALSTHTYFLKQRLDIKPQLTVSLREFPTSVFRV